MCVRVRPKNFTYEIRRPKNWFTYGDVRESSERRRKPGVYSRSRTYVKVLRTKSSPYVPYAPPIGGRIRTKTRTRK